MMEEGEEGEESSVVCAKHSRKYLYGIGALAVLILAAAWGQSVGLGGRSPAVVVNAPGVVPVASFPLAPPSLPRSVRDGSLGAIFPRSPWRCATAWSM
ncbi:MAG: hypothetical protein FD149_316 [Rhodospirillaceae bacterium]|nr:MAG: hypothetical protein FD149_316 [Rhodospirillaceae bacterium]